MNDSSSRTSLVVGTMSVGLAIALIADSLFPSTKPAPVTIPAAVELVVEPQEPTPPPRIPSPAPEEPESEAVAPEVASLRERCIDVYMSKRKSEREREERKAVREINRDAYTGGDVRAERRVYLLGQAYKRSRRATPVIFPVVQELPQEDSDTEELLDALASLDTAGEAGGVGE